jgi:hypothetical protein
MMLLGAQHKGSTKYAHISIPPIITDKAKLYNESAFLLAIETIPKLLANPPKIFEELIRYSVFQFQSLVTYTGSTSPKQVLPSFPGARS